MQRLSKLLEPHLLMDSQISISVDHCWGLNMKCPPTDKVAPDGMRLKSRGTRKTFITMSPISSKD